MNVKNIRKDFAILQNKEPPIYFDNACMTLRPNQVIQAQNEYYEEYPACAGRSGHALAEKVTEKFETARRYIKSFLNAKKDEEIIFTKNTTEGINLIKYGFSFKKGDKILLSDKEHNSNLIPWLHLQKTQGVKLSFFKHGDLQDFEKQIKGTRLVATNAVSNFDGTSQNIKEMTKIAHKDGAKILIDAAQAVPHKELNVKKLDIDFLAFSGHKMMGPTGTGVIYAKQTELEKLGSFILGGDTVKDSTQKYYELEDLPHRFEAGLQHYAGHIALGEATKYINKIGLSAIQKHEQKLNEVLTKELKDKIVIHGSPDAKKRGGILSFEVPQLDNHDVALFLDSMKKICTRSGAHCNHSWCNKHNIKGTVRVSMYAYNTEEEVSQFVETMHEIIKHY